ncbi:rho GTPase-activating protein 92B isoform X2 [Teleopsis dalmanni]|nr:rho GTPase-activating protein 92B isoform X2 [Teleopsis dalmanni]
MKRNVSRTLQEYTSLKRSYEAAVRLDEPQAKINHLKEQQEQCEVKLEKERDAWAAQMFELIAKEDVIVQCIRDYVLNQRNYHERALQRVNSSLSNIQDIIQSTVKSGFGTSLSEHLRSTNRKISHIIELCVCCLVENGLYEEGLLRVGCASTKMRRMKHALEAQYVKTPLPLEYQDPHVIGSILKLYLRELPEPLLTHKYFKEFIHSAERSSEAERKAEIKAILTKLPTENYENLRYLTKFLWLVTQNVDQNKMNSHNIAIVMSPNMLWPRMDKNNPADYMGQVNSSSAVNVIVELLVSQWDYFFEGEVDFFVTLQRHKMFVEGKSKSNSSNENLDKHDSESLESPRYGTIRRQKACAPSPPAKTYEKAHYNSNANIVHMTPDNNDTDSNYRKNGEINNRVKELFPSANNGTGVDKPEKPPLPKLPQFQQSQPQSQPQSQFQSPPQPQQQQIQTPQSTLEQQQTPKPVPMTRTQFFGLDQLPSPVADRKSTDSTGSFTFKPDLPQKPKIPKRPMVLGLNAANKSDEESCTPTPTQTNATYNILNDVSNNMRNTTENFIDKLRNEKLDNGVAITNENNHNQHLLTSEQMNSNSSISSNINSNTINSNLNTNENTNANCMATSVEKTATTPISPNMILTPKRPTVPAPPPPSVVKKQSD